MLFVALASGIGGSTRSLATVLAHLGPGVRRAVAVPGTGKLLPLLRSLSVVDAFVPLPRPPGERFQRLSRLAAAARIAAWVWRERRLLGAIHVNGPEELNVTAPAALLARVPVVVWSHARDVSRRTRVLAPLWRLLLRRVAWAAVSESARQVLVRAGLARADRVEIVPNPIDPRDVLGPGREEADGVAVGYLGSDARYKGFHLLPDVIERLAGLPVRWLLFTNERSTGNGEVWARLRAMPGERVSVLGKLADVRLAYARCDIVFCPSLEETFCRVAAEAMLNGLPVVGSDLGPVRDLVGDGEAGLLFPAGDVDAAARAIRRLVLDRELRRGLGERGRARARAFAPGRVVAQLTGLYGLATG